MDYRRAQTLKKTGLWELTKRRDIAGKGLVGGFKSAVGEKWEAKKTRIKEKFDPLNWSQFMFGNYLTAKMGKAFGRSPEDIDYFTGYNVGRSYKSKYRKRDPKRTNIGPGRVLPLKVGDSESDVLAKIYNFMVKEHDNNVKRYETEKLFREEQIEEDERRHKKLLETLTSKKKTGAEKDSGDGWLSKFFSFAKDMMKSILAPIWGFLKFVGGVGKSVFGFIGSVIATAIEGIVSIIAETVGELVKDTMSFFIHKVKDWIVANVLRRVSYLLTDLATFIIDLLPAGRAYSLAKWIANIAGVAVTSTVGADALKEIRETRDKSFVDPNMQRDQKRELEIDRQYAAQSDKLAKSGKLDNNAIRQLEKERLEARAELYQNQQDKYFKEVVEPKLKDKYIVDFADKEDYTTASGIDIKIPKIYEKNEDGSKGSQTWLWTLAPAMQLEEATKKYITEGVTQLKQTATSRASEFAESNIHKPLMQLSERAETEIGRLKKRFEEQGGGNTGVINNTTNVSGGTTELIDPTPLSSRNPDKTLEICTRTWAPSL